ncbi:MAG: choice-of-anchor tandem repeat NxxGxxAF-containing protein [Rhodothalassiaceae bacterium]
MFSSFLTGVGVDGTNDFGIFTSSGLVARAGEQAPGTGGAVFSDFVSPNLNDAGEVAFESVLTGAGVGITNNSGIFAQLADGTLELILRKGDMFDVGGGDLRTIAGLNLFDGLDDNGGDLAFLASFTDGSQGLFTADFSSLNGPLPDDPIGVPVPAPLALIGLGLGAVSLVSRRRG